MRLTTAEATKQAKVILDDLDNVKNTHTATLAMIMIGVAVMQPLRAIVENCEDGRFLEKFEDAIQGTPQWQGLRDEMFTLKERYTDESLGWVEYIDFWLAPARTFKTWIDTL